MPLKPGDSQETINTNTEELIRSGRKPSQASAIAHSEAERSGDKDAVDGDATEPTEQPQVEPGQSKDDDAA